MSIEVLTLIAIVLSPIVAILITLWHQDRKAKRDTKRGIFITLMAYRKSFPPNSVLVDSLNTIDVFFADEPKIVQLWHQYYDILCREPDPRNPDLMRHKFLELLSAMAFSLGYKHIQQTDIDKFYSPQAQVDQVLLNASLQQEFLRVLKNTGSFVVTPKENNVGKKINIK